MLVNLPTSKHLQKFKEFMKSSKLSGRDVDIYQEIIKSLNNPISVTKARNTNDHGNQSNVPSRLRK